MTLESDNVKGWSIVYVTTEGFSGLVAYKKGQPPIPVPEEFMSVEIEPEGDGVSAYSVSEKYKASSETLTGSFSVNYIIFTEEALALDGLSLLGVNKGTYKVSYVDGPDTEKESVSFAGEVSFIGGSAEFITDIFVESKSTYSFQSSDDVSAFLPIL